MEIAKDQPTHVDRGNASVEQMIYVQEEDGTVLKIDMTTTDVPLGNAFGHNYCS